MTEERNNIRTWAQGYFVPRREYKNMPSSWHREKMSEEILCVRPSPLGNAICRCARPEDAQWIAERLNLASRLEAKANSENPS